ncbi:MAG: uroporphyrinogen decarboxylase family protein [Armatimonadota bacterium]
MTSRERVIAAITFTGPDRVPFNLPAPWGTDFGGCGAGADPDFTPCVCTETEWEDEFHTIWRKLHGDKTMGQPVAYPLTDYAMLEDYVWPDYTKDVRYEGARAACANNPEDKFLLAGTPLSLIHRLEYLRGHEAAWTDPYEYPNELHKLLNIMGDIAIDSIDRLADAGAHGIMSCDDWGLQDRPMLSPAIVGEFFKPVYKRVYHHAHERGLLTLLHSCGHITELLEHFIEAELDVIQQDQQENMGVEALAERFGGRLCFWCPVDIQNTMVNGTVEEVRAYARKLIDCLGKYNGGFIAQWYASPQAVQHSQEKIDAMSEEFVEYGGRFYQQ